MKGLLICADMPSLLVPDRDNLKRPGFEGAKCVCSPRPRIPTDHEAAGRALRMAPSVYSVQTIVPSFTRNMKVVRNLLSVQSTRMAGFNI